MLEVPKHVTKFVGLIANTSFSSSFLLVAFMLYLAGLIVHLIDEYLKNRSVSSTDSPSQSCSRSPSDRGLCLRLRPKSHKRRGTSLSFDDVCFIPHIIMTWASSSRDPSHPSPTPRSPSTLPTSAEQSTDSADIGEGLPTTRSCSVKSKVEIMQLRKQQDNNRLESRSGVSYTDGTHSSSQMKASFPECGHGVDSTASLPTSTSTSKASPIKTS